MKHLFFTALFAVSVMQAQAKTRWFTEKRDNWIQKIEIEEKILQKKTALHEIKILKTSRFGKVLILDGAVESTENDGFISHEMLAHVPVLTHGSAKRVLVIGGFDGGLLHELLKHSSIQEIVYLQQDQVLLEKCKKHFSNVSHNSFDDPKVQLAVSPLNDIKGLFDVIICDSCPDTTKDFYLACQKLLEPKGIFAVKNGSFFFDSKEIAETRQNLLVVFKENSLYTASIPSAKGLTAFTLSTNDAAAKQISVEKLEDLVKGVKGKLRYYTPKIHKAAFELPPYIYELNSELPSSD